MLVTKPTKFHHPFLRMGCESWIGRLASQLRCTSWCLNKLIGSYRQPKAIVPPTQVSLRLAYTFLFYLYRVHGVLSSLDLFRSFFASCPLQSFVGFFFSVELKGGDAE